MTASRLKEYADYVANRIAIGPSVLGPIGVALWISLAYIPGAGLHETYDVTQDSFDTFIVYSLLTAIGSVYSLLFFQSHQVHWSLHVMGIISFAGFVLGFKEIIGNVSERKKLNNEKPEEFVADFAVFALTAAIVQLVFGMVFKM